MITENQRDYIISLYEELGQEYLLAEIDDLTRAAAHEVIKELLEIKNEVE